MSALPVHVTQPQPGDRGANALRGVLRSALVALRGLDLRVVVQTRDAGTKVQLTSSPDDGLSVSLDRAPQD